MPIISSAFTVGHAQADGRCYVRERHTTDLGVVHEVEYGPVGVVDYQAIATARAANISENLAAAELEHCLASGALSFTQQTKAQFAARLRARYLNSDQEDAARIASWILGHIESGDFTDTQVQNVFGLTATQWTTLKAKLTTLRTSWQSVQAARGE